jgi:hypothetical protein
MEELDPLVLNCQDDAVGVLGQCPVIAWLVLPECIDKWAKVAVGCIGFVQGAEGRLPAVERHCIARFVFYSLIRLQLNCCGLATID